LLMTHVQMRATRPYSVKLSIDGQDHAVVGRLDAHG
jgi:hypothetical protein